MIFFHGRSNVYLFLISASELANAGLFEQDVLVNRPFHRSDELYTDNQELRDRSGEPPSKNRISDHGKRASKLNYGANGLDATSKQAVNNLAAKTEAIDREFILVLVSIIFILFYFLRVKIFRYPAILEMIF